MPDLTKLRYEPVKKDPHKTEDKTMHDVAEVDRGFWKVGLLTFLTTVFALAFSFLVRVYFFEPQTFDITTLQYTIFITVFASLFAICILLTTFFVKGYSSINSTMFLSSVALALPFYNRLSTFTGIVFLLMYIMLLIATYRGWGELRLMMKVRFIRTGLKIVPTVFTALALFLSMVVFLNIQEGRVNILSKNLLDSMVLNPTEWIIEKTRLVPDFSFDKSGSQLLSEWATKKLEDHKVVDLLNSTASQEIIDESVFQTQTRIEEFIRTKVDFDQSLREMLYTLLLQQTFKDAGFSSSIVSGSAAFTAFLILKFIGVLLGLAVLLIGYIIFEILIATEFAAVVLESRTREMVILK